MSTSAKALHDLLLLANRQSRENTFCQALSIGLGKTASLEDQNYAFEICRKLALRVELDIEEKLPEELQSLAKRYFGVYRNLTAFSPYGQALKAVQDSSSGVLNKDKLKDLLSLHGFLFGNTKHEPLENEEQIISELSTLKVRIRQLKISDNVKSLICRRVDEIILAISNFRFVGTVSTLESIERLKGAIELYVPEDAKKTGVWKKATAGLMAALALIATGLSNVDSVGDSVESLVDHYGSVAGFIEDLRGEEE